MVAMSVQRLHRIGFLATLATGVGLLGASVWGLAGVDSDLSAAVRPAPPAAQRGTLVADHARPDGCGQPVLPAGSAGQADQV
jgi:hypothetical protein